MPVGNAFASLLDIDDTPAPKAKPLNKEPGELEKARAILSAKGERTSFASGIQAKEVHRDAEQAAYWQTEDAKLTRRRQAEAGAGQDFERQQAQDQHMIAEYGTADPVKAAGVKARGVFDGDLVQRMRLDPLGTKAAVNREVALSGRGGVSDLPDDAPAREYSVGKGAHGEPYYTNLSRGELKAEKHQADALRGGQSEPPVTGLKRIPGMRDEASGVTANTQDPAQILFQGKLDKAQQIAGTPERDEKHAQTIERYFQDIWDKSPDITTAREKLQRDLLHGRLGEKGITPRDVKQLDQTLIHRAKSITDMADPGVDRTFYKPWTKGGKHPGKAADLAEPATVLNPGGSMPQGALAKGRESLAVSDQTQYVDETTPREQPRTFQYATGNVPSPQPTPARQPTVGASFNNLAGQDVLAGRRKKRTQEEEEQKDYAKPGQPISIFREIGL